MRPRTMSPTEGRAAVRVLEEGVCDETEMLGRFFFEAEEMETGPAMLA